MSSSSIGKEWEKTLQSVFSSLRRGYGFSWHSFVDTHTAGTVVQSQPSDYLIMVEGVMFFLEAKASTTIKKLRPSMLRPKQRQTILHEGRLLDIPYKVIFGDLTNQKFFWFEGTDVIADGFSREYPYKLSGDIKDMEELLVKYLGLRPLTEIIKEKT